MAAIDLSRTAPSTMPSGSSSSAGDAIVVAGLHKQFGSTRALDGLDLQVRSGEVHGFLGPNGSGKSTTLRVLLGLLRASAGQVRVLDGDPWRDAVRLHRRIAYVPGEVNLWPNLSGGETIDLLGRLRGGIEPARRRELVDRFQLDPSRRFDTYSKGNRQKVALIAALASRVELYLLDEPTSGLDPLMEGEFRACVNELREEGATILLSSHILAEVEALADRVTIIRDGRTIDTGSLAELRQLARTSVTVRTRASADHVGSLAGVSGFRIEGDQASFDVDHDQLDDVMEALVRLGIESLTCAPPTLEQLFVRHYAAAADAGQAVP